MLRYDANYISWLETQGQRKRHNRFPGHASITKSLAQLMPLWAAISIASNPISFGSPGAMRKCISITNCLMAAEVRKSSTSQSLTN